MVCKSNTRVGDNQQCNEQSSCSGHQCVEDCWSISFQSQYDQDTKRIQQCSKIFDFQWAGCWRISFQFTMHWASLLWWAGFWNNPFKSASLMNVCLPVSRDPFKLAVYRLPPFQWTKHWTWCCPSIWRWGFTDFASTSTIFSCVKCTYNTLRILIRMLSPDICMLAIRPDLYIILMHLLCNTEYLPLIFQNNVLIIHLE